MSDTAYFEIVDDTLKDKFFRIASTRNDTRKAWREFLEDNGGERVYQLNGRFCGISFGKNKPTEGWRRDRNISDLYVPSRKTKAGKAIAERMESLPKEVRGEDIGNALFGCGMYMYVREGQRLMMATPGFGQYGDTILVSMALPSSGKLPSGVSTKGLRRLKASEYWAIREAVEEKEATND